MARKTGAAAGAETAGATGAVPPAVRRFAPYRNQAFNFLYNLLFCDDIDLFRSAGNKEPEGPWSPLLAEQVDASALRAIAEDPSQESRIRVLAYNRLREQKEPVAPKQLLGVIVEVGLERGLDVLAAFPDGRVRYINQYERMEVFEAAPAGIRSKITQLLEAAQAVVDRLGPWDKARLAPPPRGTVRITFLVSDGLYFGQGPLAVMQEDPIGGPVIAASLDLLRAVVDESLGGSA